MAWIAGEPPTPWPPTVKSGMMPSTAPVARTICAAIWKSCASLSLSRLSCSFALMLLERGVVVVPLLGDLAGALEHLDLRLGRLDLHAP